MKIISSHIHAFFFHNFSMLWGEVASNSIDFQKFIFFFYNFNRSSLFFDQSKLRLKISVSLRLFRLIKTVFRSIEYCESGFLKNETWLFQKHLYKSFSSFLSLSLIQTWLYLRFLSFFIFLFARFLSPNTGKTLLPFFLFLFSHFMHFHAF